MIKSFIFIAAATLVAACGGKDCEELCQEGQAGDCTAIEGNCSSFCAAIDDIQDEAGCADEREDYEDCLNGKDNVCDIGCGVEENAFESCFTAYCLSNASNPSCVTLAQSF